MSGQPVLMWVKSRSPRDGVALCHGCGQELHPHDGGEEIKFLVDMQRVRKDNPVIPSGTGRIAIMRYCTPECAPQPESGEGEGEGSGGEDGEPEQGQSDTPSEKKGESESDTKDNGTPQKSGDGTTNGNPSPSGSSTSSGGGGADNDPAPHEGSGGGDGEARGANTDYGAKWETRAPAGKGRERPTCDGHKECEQDCRTCELWTGQTPK